ncbi:MAG: hypothetical protein ACRDTU_05210 [Micromonosporaceae bacterium]
MLIRTKEAEDAVAIRQLVGDRLGGWSEQMIRAQLEAHPDGDPEAMVALAMAAGGGPIQQESLDLLRRAADGGDAKASGLAAYALQVAVDLAEPPIIRREQEHDLAEVLRPERPVDGDEGWVTARVGVPGRAIPREVTWLRVPGAPVSDAARASAGA